MATLIADQSEDLVGQVAESLTRIIEELPFLLTQRIYSLLIRRRIRLKKPWRIT